VLDLRLAPASDAGAAEVRQVDTDATAEELRLAAGRLARELDAPATLDVSGLAGERLSAFVEGLVLGGHRLKPAPTNLTLGLIGVEDEAAAERGRRAAEATLWARELANTPAATKTPSWLGAQAARELAPLGVEVTVRDEQWLADEGFGGVLAVGAGSSAPPRLIEASWRPRRTRAGVHAVIVGKGITFDTGGINLKHGSGMRNMHTDMAAGAAALAALRLIAEQRLPVRVTVLAPAAENSMSGAAMRPSDVVRHFGGRTSEITNTDAEGRLVLADALAYAARRLRPSVLVDLATLTGAMKVALGLRTAGVFATTDGLARALVRAGERAGEPLWRLPLADDYAHTLDSYIADANNAPGNPGGVTAALFLRPFAQDVPWAHLDIAGPARAPKDDGILTQGATGFGARLLAHWAETLV
jgi:leucyl aminopeptidase